MKFGDDSLAENDDDELSEAKGESDEAFYSMNDGFDEENTDPQNSTKQQSRDVEEMD